MNEPQRNYMTAEEFLEGAEPTTVFKDAVKELTEARQKSGVNEEQVRLNDTWTILANQVVGQEKL